MKNSSKKYLNYTFLLVCFFIQSCDIYAILYKEFSLEIVNNTNFNINSVEILKDKEIIINDINYIMPGESEEYRLSERRIYHIKGSLDDGTIFFMNVDFRNTEKIVMEIGR